MSSILIPVVALTLLALLFGVILGFAAIRFRVKADPIVDKIDAILPQTQCGQCGYPGCRPYAEAIANGDEINKCPPGGEATIKKLADLMGVEPKPLVGTEAEAPADDEEVKKVAFIREEDCIGCTKCIQACPVDAIVGATKQMHTVIVDECTGCDLCVDPCPTNCIEMVPVPITPEKWNWKLNTIPVNVIE